ncbi:MAG: S41 family peptidase [Defluviitaleaceae bacterium]|nr:S41 family peptidase [Defluviitaleaceae bacterium]
MRKMIFCVTFLLLSITSFSACGRGNTGISLDDALEIAHARREGIIMPGDDFLAGLTEGRAPQTLDLSRLAQRPRRTATISAYDAIYDVTLFFEILRQFYGPYIYFGGDGVFIPARDGVIATLVAQDYWPIGQVANLMYNALDTVVNDNHFFMGSRSLVNFYEFFIAFHDVRFGKSEGGFYNLDSGAYVTDLILHGVSLFDDTENLFRLSLDSYGVLYYSLVFVQARDSAVTNINVTIVYENGDAFDYLFTRMWSMGGRASGESSLTFRDGIPVVAIREMGWPFSSEVFGFAGTNRERAQDFLRTAPKLRDEPVIIVDVRQNRGGNGALGQYWLRLLTGEIVPTNARGFFVVNQEKGGFTNVFDGVADLFYYLDEFTEYFGIDLHDFSEVDVVEGMWTDENHFMYGYIPDRIVPNDRLLIFLTDRRTASAGEYFVDMAFNMQNTLVVGQNTSGTLLTGMTISGLSLPHTGMTFSFGGNMAVFPKGHLPEGIGLTPDIWVNGDALEAVLAMLER